MYKNFDKMSLKKFTYHYKKGHRIPFPCIKPLHVFYKDRTGTFNLRLNDLHVRKFNRNCTTSPVCTEHPNCKCLRFSYHQGFD